ncbi:MAG: GNAT family N-acetyltransferase [Planctomycetota bacterium]|nr:GNAT family N-acetyltransferase [Planctomycetota bacterium]
MASVYNRLTYRTPYCYPLTPELLREAVTAKDGFDPAGFFVACRDGSPLGFLHAGLIGEDRRTGSVFLFIAEDRDACYALLDAALDFFKRGGVTHCYTMSNLSLSNDYYAGVHMGYEVGLWSGFYQVCEVFRRRGFELIRERFVMRRDLAERPDEAVSDEAFELAVEPEPDTGSFYTNGAVVARDSGRCIGRCGYHMLTQVSRHFGRGIGQITMGVDEEYHGKGVGAAMLTRAHCELHDQGARQVILTTNYAFYPAIRFYEKLGYRKELIHLPVYAAYFE